VELQAIGTAAALPLRFRPCHSASRLIAIHHSDHGFVSHDLQVLCIAIAPPGALRVCALETFASTEGWSTTSAATCPWAGWAGASLALPIFFFFSKDDSNLQLANSQSFAHSRILDSLDG
jgi:hypothetical protein